MFESQKDIKISNLTNNFPVPLTNDYAYIIQRFELDNKMK